MFDRDLETIGAVALGQRLSVGASGIGLGLARALVASGRVTAQCAMRSRGADVGGPAACLAGSCSQATLQQIASAEAVMPVLHLDAAQTIAGREEAQRALAWARDHLGQRPRPDRFSSSTPDQVAALQARHGRDAAGHAIEQAMADIAEGLVNSACGGWWSPAAKPRARWWIGSAFPVFWSARKSPPVFRCCAPWARKRGEMLLALKSGNFGGPEFFSDALALMR